MKNSAPYPYPQLTESVSHPLLPGITDRRLNLFLDGHYRAHNLSSALDIARLDDEEHVSMCVWSAPGLSKPSFHAAIEHLSPYFKNPRKSIHTNGHASKSNGDAGTVRPYKKGDRLGPSWTNHWVYVHLSIPQQWASVNEPVIFEFDPECEALIFTMDGRPIHAITGGPNSSKDGVPGDQEDRRVAHVVPREAVEEGEYEIIIEVSVNAMFGLGLNGFRHQQPDMNVFFKLAGADLVLINSEAHALEIDFAILTQIARGTGKETSSISQRALKACNDIMNAWEGPDPIPTCRKIAQRIIAEHPTPINDAQVWGIGHCHIDTAWLWTYSVSQQKIARSWSTQIDLMRRFPEHRFAASSAQQYAWLEELYPETFAEVSEMAAKGQFVPVGGAWLEHDCVLPSGESLCRQYLYGQRYFQEKFGVRCREAWLPDTFGYASQLPQILRLAGIDYFFTQKLSWNNINIFPYSTFNWCGLDGSQVLSHMTPVDTYNATASYQEMLKGAQRNKNLGVTNECLLLFGNGDGGGGPTPRMLEKLRRLRSITTPETPSIKLDVPEKFFDSICQKTSGGKDLPTWRGELYFELHRGTYTSQAGLKDGNRSMEKLLRDVEYFATLASLSHPGRYQYPQESLDKIWKDVLLGQFHDVLPGTSIKMAIDDQLEIYERRKADSMILLDEALRTLIDQSANAVSVIDPIRQAGRHIALIAGKPALVATDSAGCGQVIQAPPDMASPRASQTGNSSTLENASFKLSIESGRITSLFDKREDRELIKAGTSATTGGLMLYADFPLAYDAWDTEIYHLDCGKEIFFDEVLIQNDSPLRSSLRATANFGSSTAILTFSLDAVAPDGSMGEGWIRVDAEVDWHEKHIFLKFVLPLDIHSSYATYGTQYGLIDRPTHRNTTLDQAKFEVCGHRLADLSEAGYGVALVADKKYGYSVEGNVMRLSLLRAATAPDPVQDQGKHVFDFAVMPHRGRLLESDTIAQAARFCDPVYIRTGNYSAPMSFELVGPQARNIVLDCVKRGQDDDKDRRKAIILRLYETLGGRAATDVVLSGIKPFAIEEVNILEESIADKGHTIQWKHNGDITRVALVFRPFEVKTLAIKL